MTSQSSDWADQHVSSWRTHWKDVDFDEDTEAILIRLGRILRHVDKETKKAVRSAGLRDYEFETLHGILVNETPGEGAPSVLADELGVSGAGMTGRLDALERNGWIKRHPQTVDRRRIDIKATPSGVDVWRKAVELRNQVDSQALAALTEEERTTLATLLRKIVTTLD